jgi:hypothetical protein
MNIYEKIQLVKDGLLKSNLKKSGENKFAGFKYYELADITPKLIELCNKHKLHTSISFTRDLAILTITNIEKIDEQVVYTSPMEELELKGCNKIQALGGTETYQRRYLYMTAFDIIENDMFDAQSGTEKNTASKKTTKKELTNREELIKYCKENNLDVVEIAKKYNLTKTSTDEDYKTALTTLMLEN